VTTPVAVSGSVGLAFAIRAILGGGCGPERRGSND
jgi:hypothetical protein